MGELRKDYLLDRFVLMSTVRSKRPQDFKKPETDQEKRHNHSPTCVFCPGNESMTPPEIDRLGDKNRWSIRVFENKFPAVTKEGHYDMKTDNRFFTFSSAYGIHEILVETEDHSRQLGDLTLDEIVNVLKMYVKRINVLSKVRGIKYVVVFKNEGASAAASKEHTHSQIVAYNKVPQTIREEVDAATDFMTCPYCEIISIEKTSYRAALENNTFVSFTPYASRFPFEIWVFSKRHVNSITEINEPEIKDLADMLKKILLKLKTLNASYNFCLHNAPNGENLHFHVEVIPRLSTWAGFEYGSGDIINTVLPEDAAKFYKE